MADTTLQAGDLFKAGRLEEALAAANAAVKAAPTDLGRRVLLAELLLASGNLERADVILDAAGQLDPSAATVVAEFRQLLRAETARRQLYRDGRVPEFLGEPEPSLQASLAALVALREGDAEAAA
ncbi:MAG TPA: tetratricopeptide repeat protein, partial [Acidocella sp.]|nr:tetratricopeptide repeat protein [Acidocella sp.]